MNEQPQTWHYGLTARWWAEFNAEPAPEELAFYRGVIERDGQPALDLGCGAGALTIAAYRASYAVALKARQPVDRAGDVPPS